MSSFDTSQVTVMNGMFSSMPALRELTLGESFIFRNVTNLPAIRRNNEFTGYWQNIGSGTTDDPQGEFVFTSAQLTADGSRVADTWVWQPVNRPIPAPVCQVVAEGRFANQSAAQGGVAGAQWRVCEDGTLEIDGGFINWTLYTGPWQTYRDEITNIVITGPITAGASLRSLFREMNYVTEIEGLTYFDTTRTTSMENMFRTSTGFVRLDLRSFDTTNVTNMHRMFTNMHALETIIISDNFTIAENSGLPAGVEIIIE